MSAEYELGDTLASGEKTYRFSPVTSPEMSVRVDHVINAISETNRQMGLLQADMAKSTDELTDRIEVLSHTVTILGDQAVTKVQHADDMKVLEDYTANVMQLLVIFLRSPLMRFLNLFGCWYIYGKGGSIYPNNDEFASYGKRPLLTRLKLGLKDLRGRITMWFASKFL